MHNVVQGHYPLHWAALNNRTAEVEILIAVRPCEASPRLGLNMSHDHCICTAVRLRPWQAGSHSA